MTFYTERIYSEAFDNGVNYAIQRMFGSGRIAKKKAKQAQAAELEAQKAAEKAAFKQGKQEYDLIKKKAREERRAAEAANPQPAQPKTVSPGVQRRKLGAQASAASHSYQKAAIAALDAKDAAQNAIGTSAYGELANKYSQLRAIADEKQENYQAIKNKKKEVTTQMRDAVKEAEQAESQRRMAIAADRARKREEKRQTKLKAKNEARAPERQAYLQNIHDNGAWTPKPIDDPAPTVPKNPVRAARKEHGRLDVTPEEIAAADKRVNGPLYESNTGTGTTTTTSQSTPTGKTNVGGSNGSKGGRTTTKSKPKPSTPAAKGGLMNWIKTNPYKSAGIAAAGLGALGYGGYKFATRGRDDEE
jgi:hypothetical protein